MNLFYKQLFITKRSKYKLQEDSTLCVQIKIGPI